jgi:hypothetical protein
MEEPMPPHVQERSDRTDELLTVADIVGHIGAHEQIIRGWIHTGELKASKFGTRIGWRIRRANDDAFLRRHQLGGAIARRVLSLGTHEPDPATCDTADGRRGRHPGGWKAWNPSS